MKMYWLANRQRLVDDEGRLFDPVRRVWSNGSSSSELGKPGEPGVPVGSVEAVQCIQHGGGPRIRMPVGVIGPRQPVGDQYERAEELGLRLAEAGLSVLCGGKGGVMEAVCKGVARGGGVSIGLLPEGDDALANPYASITIAGGIGIARNAIIAQSALCLAAVGGGYGTLSEIALGMQFGKVVIGMADPPAVDGVAAVESIADCMRLISLAALSISLPQDTLYVR